MTAIYDIPGKLPTDRRYAVAIGVFDGLHLGHQEIFRYLKSMADAAKAVPAVLFFAPFPRNVLQPAHAIPSILTLQQKIDGMARLGIEAVIQMTFTPELASLTPREFMDTYFFGSNIRPSFIGFCVGEDWRFGRKNSGDASTLKSICAEYGVEARIVPPVWRGDAIISSTRIRREIEAGNLQEAHTLLGHPLEMAGTVVRGQRIATSKLSCPTANIIPDPTLVLPPYGVYATTARLDDGSTYQAIAYIGDAPTFRQNDTHVIVEIHLLDTDCQLYGRTLTLQLLEFLRPSLRFASPEALAAQIQNDICRVRELNATTRTTL